MTTLQICFNKFIQVFNCFFDELLTSNEIENSEESLFDEKIVIWFKITEPDWIFKLLVFLNSYIRVIFSLNIRIKIINNVLEFIAKNVLQLSINIWSKVIQSVNKASNISLERPASPRLHEISQQILKRISFNKFTNIDNIIVINERSHQLKERTNIGKFGTHNDLLTIFIIPFIFGNHLLNLLFCYFVHDILVTVILHYF